MPTLERQKLMRRHDPYVSPERGRQIEKRCLAYVLAVGGTALLTAPAHAEIVYTPTQVSVLIGTIPVDLNNDGISDVQIEDLSLFGSSSGSILGLSVRGAQNASARVIGRKNGLFQAGSVFPAPYGFSIGPNSPKSFIGPLRTGSGPVMVQGSNFAGSLDRFFGPWQNKTNRYLGIQFSINGQTHYGWARLTVKTYFNERSRTIHIRATLTGYAYETQPNTAILAGDQGPTAQPKGASAEDSRTLASPSLGLLSLGSAGLDVWRPDKQGPAAH